MVVYIRSTDSDSTMTSPHVTELPRKLEPVGHDTFLGDPPVELAPGRIDDVVQLGSLAAAALSTAPLGAA
jgi:hypothetical protein